MAVAYPGFKGGGGAGHVIPVAWPIFVGRAAPGDGLLSPSRVQRAVGD